MKAWFFYLLAAHGKIIVVGFCLLCMLLMLFAAYVDWQNEKGNRP